MQTVTAAILMKDGKVLIAQRMRGDRLAYKWEFPGGKMEDGETPEQCLAREMREEFGIIVAVAEFFAESLYEYEHGAIRLKAYITDWLGGEFRPTAHRDYRWVSISDLAAFDFAPADIPLVAKLKESLQ